MAKYPAPGTPGSKYRDEKARMADSMGSGFFTCHVRTIANAFKDKAWVGQYSRGLGKHGVFNFVVITVGGYDAGFKEGFVVFEVVGNESSGFV